MKQFVLAFVLCSVAHISSAQAQTSPVTWSFDVEKVGDQKYLLKFTADINKGWVVYSQHLDEGGPVPTGCFFNDSKEVKMIGNVEEKSDAIKNMDELFGMEVIKYKEVADFEQLVEVSSAPQIIDGELEYMTCDGSRCLPPTTVEFKFEIN